MNQKIDRFTNNARRVLSQAQSIAEAEKHDLIYPAHILAGFLNVESATKQILEKAGVRFSHVQEMVKNNVPRPFRKPKLLDLARETKYLLQLSVSQASYLNHWYIGTGHLLLGMIEQQGSAAKVLFKKLRINPNTIRDEIKQSFTIDYEVEPKNRGERLAWMLMQARELGNYNINLKITPKEGESARVEAAQPLEDITTLEQLQEFLTLLLHPIVNHRHSGEVVNFSIGNFQCSISVSPPDSSGEPS